MSLFPYDPTLWGQLCFGGLDEGALEPHPTPSNAQEAMAAMPPGTKFRVLVREVPSSMNPLWGLQITDASHEGRLGHERELYPTLWARFDTATPQAQLTSYTHLMPYGTLEVTPQAVRECAEVVVLVTPPNQPLDASELPLITRRV